MGFRKKRFLIPYMLLCMGLQSFSPVPLYKQEDLYTSPKIYTQRISPLDHEAMQQAKHLLFRDHEINSSNTGHLNSDETPNITIEVALLNCKAWEECNANPQIEFAVKGENHRSLAGPLVVQIGADKITCANQFCIIDMPLTNDSGEIVQYWTETTEGTILISRTFKIRNRILGAKGSPHYFEIIGDDFPYPIDTCANIWDIFPDQSDLKLPWLKKVEDSDDLYTDIDFSWLAGQLIWHGYVIARDCDDGGMLPNGIASQCGIEKALEKIIEWQNKYNQQILDSANEIDIPPRIVKGLVAQESQFWPEWKNGNEAGYGMISDFGMDMLLTWNTDYFLKICKSYYPRSECMGGYSALPSDKKSILRGICLSSAGTDREFVVIANTLKAGCSQTRTLVENITDEPPEKVFTYKDLWRINLGIYNTGSGCMGEAIKCAWEDYGHAITWDEFVPCIPEYCSNAITYFDKVTYYGAFSIDQ